ncbi:MAG: glycosyltransferase [Phycisphaeraceae bacterium]
MFNKVLILSASAGAGHMRAAEALEKAFVEQGAAREVRHVDTLQYTTAMFRKVYADAYIKLVNGFPTILGWLYDRLDDPEDDRRLSQILNKLNAVRFTRMLLEFQPDIAVCTHFLPSELVARQKRKGHLNCPLATVVTDMDVHAYWLCPGCEHYFVAIDETAVHLREMGVPEGDLTVSGIPIDPVFAQPKSKADMRRHYGLEPETTTILVATGGFGVGPIDHLIQSLLKIRHRVQLVVICGRNEELKIKLDDMAASLAGQRPEMPRMHIVGFTREMDQYMAASDILVGKPGGLTTSEALAKGLVMCIVNPIPGQEERNSDHLLEEGAAIRCNNLPTLAWKIDQLLDDPARLAAIHANVARLGHADAAHRIVKRLLTLETRTIGKPTPRQRLAGRQDSVAGRLL